MTSELFSESESYLGNSIVSVGNGNTIPISRIWSIIFYVNSRKIKITQVILCVFKLNKMLISAKKTAWMFLLSLWENWRERDYMFYTSFKIYRIEKCYGWRDGSFSSKSNMDSSTSSTMYEYNYWK